MFRNVGTQNSDAGESLKRKNTSCVVFLWPVSAIQFGFYVIDLYD